MWIFLSSWIPLVLLKHVLQNQLTLKSIINHLKTHCFQIGLPKNHLLTTQFFFSNFFHLKMSKKKGTKAKNTGRIWHANDKENRKHLYKKMKDSENLSDNSMLQPLVIKATTSWCFLYNIYNIQSSLYLWPQWKCHSCWNLYIPGIQVPGTKNKGLSYGNSGKSKG